MPRSAEAELAQRINTTIDWLGELPSTEAVIVALIERFRVSRRQAYRYIREAQQREHKRDIPEVKVAFTVKLPLGVVVRLRQLATSTGHSLSALVSEALVAFLKRGRHG
jgi:predicted DNA-binding transcriptional regulator YafY